MEALLAEMLAVFVGILGVQEPVQIFEPHIMVLLVLGDDEEIDP